MKVPEMTIRLCCSMTTTRGCAWLILFLLCIGPSRSARAQQPETSGSASNALLNTDHVVENVARMNRDLAQALHAYHGTRFYRVEYRGVPGAHSAEMEVDVAYQSPQTKEFTLRWTTGSKVIIDRVFKTRSPLRDKPMITLDAAP